MDDLVYLDNAATAFPKPKEVYDFMYDFYKNRGVSNSQISEWIDCPYKIYLKHVLKCAPIHCDTTLYEVGAKYHDSVEKYYKNHYSHERSQNDILYYAYEILKEMWDADLPVEEKKQVEMFQKVYHCLENFSKFEAKRLVACGLWETSKICIIGFSMI